VQNDAVTTRNRPAEKRTRLRVNGESYDDHPMAPMVTWTKSQTRTVHPDVAEQALLRTHSMVTLDVGADGVPFGFEETVTGSPHISLESTSCSGVVDGQLVSGDAVLVAWLKSGRGELRDHPVPIGRPMLYRPTAESFRWEAFHKDVLRISRHVVETVAGERGGWVPGPLEFDPLHVPEGAPLAAWWVMVRSVAAAILTGPQTVTEDREQELARFAAGGLLAAIPHWPVGKPHVSRAQSRLAVAEAFMLEHVREPVKVEAIANAAGLSVRGLQEAFHRDHGTTPTKFLLGVRLSLAQEELTSGTAESVESVARGVGFTHMSRFAASYAAEFGERPSDTLRAARLSPRD
jgi:AraC-like DNA-binding protein